MGEAGKNTGQQQRVARGASIPTHRAPWKHRRQLEPSPSSMTQEHLFRKTRPWWGCQFCLDLRAGSPRQSWREEMKMHQARRGGAEESATCRQTTTNMQGSGLSPSPASARLGYQEADSNHLSHADMATPWRQSWCVCLCRALPLEVWLRSASKRSTPGSARCVRGSGRNHWHPHSG